MRALFVILAVFLFSCSGTNNNNGFVTDSTIVKPDPLLQGANNSTSAATKLIFQNVEGEAGVSTGSVEVGEIICFVAGKFNSSDVLDTAYVIKTKQGVGNPIEDGTPDEYELRFTGSTKSVNIGCCDARLVNEGDLNNNGKEELTVFQYPINGCTDYVRTYSNDNNIWKEFIESFLFPSACESVTDDELQSLVSIKDDMVYYKNMTDTTINDEPQFYPVMEKASLK